ncbi:hypothetical protein Mal15_01370 [Stieleria maiorica]|uniref:Uncharacterized protein n=1 Tax=Stieleria maiorica TaxID=2795974 RepID=A0A5B9M4Q1_9BACT|nr:hypothetical protein [Stieleria maiorica]QEF96111.1 hypothetical protein Mal15_01370 [Stieleria maiorica]
MTRPRPRRALVLLGLWVVALPNVLAAPDVLSAQDVSPSEGLPAQIAAAARQSADQLDPNRIAGVDPSGAAFQAAIDGLREHLSKTATEANAQAWIDYLEIEPALEAIASEVSDVDVATKATRISQKATGIHPGLEVPAVRDVRRTAQQYSNALRFRRKERTTALLGQLLERAADQWTEMTTSPSPDEIATLRLLLELLERTDQPVALVDRTQTLFSSTNLHLTVDESLVGRVANRRVDQSSAVRECILGTRIVGNALLTGDVTATLLPSTGSIRMQVALHGTVTTANRGYNGPVRLRTSGFGHVHASRTLQIRESGIQFDPVVVSGGINNRINSIEHPLRLVRRIAQKKAAQQKPLADRIAHRKFIARITDEFTKETEGALAQPMPDLAGQAEAYLQRLDFAEPLRTIGSTAHSIYLKATIRKNNQLAAPTPPPAITATNDATIQIHESLVDNTIGALLAGRTMTRTELQQLASKTKRGAEIQAAAADEEEEEPDFEIDFHDSRPIIFEARDGKLRIGIQGTRFAQGSRELKRLLEIVAVYQPRTTETGEIVLERVGETEINFPGTKRLSVAQAGLRGSIKKGFAKAFPETLMDRPWIIPADAKVPALQGQNFRPRYFEAQDGWLTLGVSS